MLKIWYRRLVVFSLAAIFVETLLILLAGFQVDSRWQMTSRVTTTNLLLAEKYLKLGETRDECKTLLAQNESLNQNLESVTISRLEGSKIRINFDQQAPVSDFYQKLLSGTKTLQAGNDRKNESSENKELFLTAFGEEPGNATSATSANVIKVKRSTDSVKSSQSTELKSPSTGSATLIEKNSTPDESFKYNVKSGDSLWLISKKYNVSVNRLKSLNRLGGEQLKIGQELFIPGKKDMGGMNWPVRGRLSSGYGYRINPISKTREFHAAIDVAAPLGTSVKAADSGKVDYAGWIRGYGKVVKLVHSNGFSSLYAHLDEILVKKGQKVTKEHQIGKVGTTGYSTGPHLHFEVLQHGRQLNPLKYLP